LCSLRVRVDIDIGVVRVLRREAHALRIWAECEEKLARRGFRKRGFRARSAVLWADWAGLISTPDTPHHSTYLTYKEANRPGRNGGYNSRPYWYVPIQPGAYIPTSRLRVGCDALQPASHIPSITPTSLLTPPRAGNSKPRLVQAIQSALPSSTKTTTTTKPKTTKANTSQPRAATRVTKTTTTVKKPRTKTQKVVDAIVGTGEKVKGDVEGKPGVKVRFFLFLGFSEFVGRAEMRCFNAKLT
jgi:hypothetical protein